MKFIKSIIKYIALFTFGGTTYFTGEVLWRGHSHWTMYVLGGLCFVAVGLINNIFPWSMKLELQALIGAVLITALELITGLVVNIHLGWNIWDYSDVPFNFLGQICLPYCILWYILSVIIIVLDDDIRYQYFGERKPTYESIFKDIRRL